jgi:MFS family permease
VLAGLTLAAVGSLAFAIAPGFGTALTARLASGAGGALLNVVLSAMVMTRFTGATLAPAMGGFLATHPFGIGLSMVALPALAAAALSWRVAMLVVPGVCAVVLLAVPFVLASRSAHTATTAMSADIGLKGSLLHSGEWGPVLAAGIAWAALNVGFAVLFGFAPALLTERGASPEAAGALASLAGWASIPLAPLGGALAERTGRPLLATAACLGGVAAAMLALSMGIGPQSGALLAAGLLGSIAATVVMTLPARALAPESRPFGMGVYWTIFYAGMAVLPPLAGWAADVSSGAAGALMMASMFYALAVAAVAAFGVLLARQRPGAGSALGRA